MKLKTLKPLYLGSSVLTEGRVFVTDEQHGRELLARGFAAAHEGDEEPEVDLGNPATPGEPLLSDSLQGKSPTYKPHHKGGGKWVVVDSGNEPVGDFSGNRDEATAEAERLNAGGEPPSQEENPSGE